MFIVSKHSKRVFGAYIDRANTGLRTALSKHQCLSWLWILSVSSSTSLETFFSIETFVIQEISIKFAKLQNSTYKYDEITLGAPVASFPGFRAGEEEREPGTHCSRMCQVSLVICILLCCTKITVNSAYLLRGHTAWLYSFWDSSGRFLSQKQYRFAGDRLHCFVRSDRWTSKEKIASVTCCSV